MKAFKILAFLGVIVATTLLVDSCKKKTNNTASTAKLGIDSMVITNSGKEGKTIVKGVWNVDTCVITISLLSDFSKLNLRIYPQSGTSTTPVSGTFDFTKNEKQAIVATKGADAKTYYVRVAKSALTNEVALVSFDLTGVSSPSYNMVYAKDSIVLAFTNLSGTTAVLNNFVVNPSGAQITASAGWDAGTNTLTYDFANQTNNPTITVSFGSQSVTYKIGAKISKAGFDKTTANPLLDQAQINTSWADGALYSGSSTRSADFDGQFVYLASRQGGNNIFYYDVTDATKTQHTLSTTGIETAVAGSTFFPVSDIKVAAGKIYVSAMCTYSTSSTPPGKFYVYRWDSKTSNPVKIIDYNYEANGINAGKDVRLGDAISVLGDPSTNGYIISANWNEASLQGQLFIWKFTNGITDVANPQIVAISGFTASPTTAGFGQTVRVSEIPGENKYLLTGANCGFIILNSDFTYYDQIAGGGTIDLLNGRTFDVQVFAYNGARYVAWTYNNDGPGTPGKPDQGSSIVVKALSGNTYVDGLLALKTVNLTMGQDAGVANLTYMNQFGNVASNPVAANFRAVEVNGKLRIMGFSSKNGFRVVELGY